MASMSAILSPAQTADKPKLLDQVRDVIRRKHFSIRTEQAYVEWIKRYILFHGIRHPNEMAEEEVRRISDSSCARSQRRSLNSESARKLRSRAGSAYKNSSMFYVYVLLSEADSGFYIGYTNNLRIRLKEHRAGKSFATAHRRR